MTSLNRQNAQKGHLIVEKVNVIGRCNVLQDKPIAQLDRASDYGSEG